MKDTDTVAMFTIGTISFSSDNSLNEKNKLHLLEYLKGGFKIISAVPTATEKYACITYILEKGIHEN